MNHVLRHSVSLQRKGAKRSNPIPVSLETSIGLHDHRSVELLTACWGLFIRFSRKASLFFRGLSLFPFLVPLVKDMWPSKMTASAAVVARSQIIVIYGFLIEPSGTGLGFWKFQFFSHLAIIGNNGSAIVLKFFEDAPCREGAIRL